MSSLDLDRTMEKLLARGFKEAALGHVVSSVEQVRFSGNEKDLYNTWEQSSLMIFASNGKKIASTSIKDFSGIEESIEKMWEVSGKIPDNGTYEGINPEKRGYQPFAEIQRRDYDLQDMTTGMVNSALENGAERTSGVLYNRRDRITVRTNYNECTYETGGIEAVIRSFRGENTGQEGRHFGLGFKIDSDKIEQIGRESAEPLRLAENTHSIEPGKFKILMSPYVIGNLISYSSGFLSYYMVETGLSCFADRLEKKVSNENFSLVDDPLDSTGVGYRLCDEEGSPARRNTLIDRGILRKFMHSYSTSRRAGTETTGNAGIISPRAWQLRILPGDHDSGKMLSEMDEGLFINNCWYTRYQDYRNGVFSTVPRDGVFYVKNGEIVGSVKGIRISDSIPNVLSGITQISKDTKNVKWWEEISASSMPSVLTRDIGISRAF